MKLRGALSSAVFWFSLSHAIGLKEEARFSPVKYHHDWGLSETLLHRRQVPVVIAPPAVPRPITNTPLVPQPTSSLNYWWPYGSNGVNPTSTPTQTSALGSTHSTSTMDDPTSDATMDEITSTMSSSTSEVGTSATTTTTAKEAPSDTPESTPKSNIPGFQVISLLPLFIILGVLLLATFMGWTYGRCVRWCQRHGEPAPGGANIGGRPYEFRGYDSDTIGPMRSAGIGWVDASRIYDYDASAAVAYHAIRSGQPSEPGTPSKTKDRAPRPGGWFRHTFSRRKRPNENSPSGEKGLNHPADETRTRRTLPSLAYGQLTSQRISSSPSDLESPKFLRVVNGSPSTLGNGVQSPATSTQPTPHISASRHVSIRRKLVEKVRAEDEGSLLAASGMPGVFRSFEDEDRQADDWAKADPLKRSPARRFASRANASRSPESLTRSPDPQEHRARIRRLRAAAQASAPVSNVTSPSETFEACHPLPPAPNVLLSPPLQPHLFFTGSDQDDASLKGDDLSLAQDDRSRNLNGRTVELAVDDPFGPLIAPSVQHMQRTRAKGKPLKYRTESTETAPLSPELRDAAMTRLEEIVKTNWSMRNLAGVPQSPTLFVMAFTQKTKITKLKPKIHSWTN
ncbi:hypothetical protein FRC10_001750 [Ceratobasidium sp. 414]|nr:hypothetical protein FRC10_001750 [Ceratobasidium sp. 414]